MEEEEQDGQAISICFQSQGHVKVAYRCSKLNAYIACLVVGDGSTLIILLPLPTHCDLALRSRSLK